LTNSEVSPKQNIVSIPDKGKEGGEVLTSNSELPTDELIKKHDKAIGAIMGHLRAKSIEEKETKRAHGIWQKEARDANQEYAKKTQMRKGLMGTLGYIGVIALFNAGMAAWLGPAWQVTVGSWPIIGGMVGYLGMVVGSVVRGLPFYRKLDTSVNKLLDKNLPEAKRKEAIMARNPSSPENKKILDFKIAEKIKNGVKKRQETSPQKEVTKNALPKEVLAEMKALQANTN